MTRRTLLSAAIRTILGAPVAAVAAKALAPQPGLSFYDVASSGRPMYPNEFADLMNHYRAQVARAFVKDIIDGHDLTVIRNRT